MTIEQEIRQRLLAMGLDEESVGPCLEYVKADPLMRGVGDCWRYLTTQVHPTTRESFWLAAKSSALDYLEKKYHVEARKETANETQANG